MSPLNAPARTTSPQADQAKSWEERERLRQAVEKAYTGRVSRIDELVDSFAELTAQPLHATDDSEIWVGSIRQANLDSLVFITVKVTRANGLTDIFTSTGLIVRPDGYVLTSNHAIPSAAKSDYTKIEQTGSVGGCHEYAYPLTIVHRDEQRDVMLLKLPHKNLWTSVKSLGVAQIGSEIVALGFPLDKDVVAEPGSIIGVDHDGRWVSNAGIIPGMLGGPVFNRSSAVVGIVTGRYEDAKSLDLIIPISFSTSLLQFINSPLSTASATSNNITPIPLPSPTALPIIGMAKTLWHNLRSFMRWDVFPKDYKTFLEAFVVNGAVGGVIYFLFDLAQYGIAPAKFAAWHEWIANRGIPFSENVSKILAPFLLDTPHCLDAVVRRYQQRAGHLFDSAPEVKTRPKWVPAPLLLGDELLQHSAPSPTKPADKPYVAGLQEIRARLGKGDERWTISIEGPGGVGKSALAFEIARWASDGRIDYRLAPFPMLPIVLESFERRSDKTETVDTATAVQLRSVMNAVRISDRLLQALLTRKRVLVVLDGFSEILQGESDEMIRSEKGRGYVQALVITSRRPTNLRESLVIRPQGLTLAFLDRVLDDLIAANAAPGRFNDDEREELRRRVRSLIDGVKERQVPMIFLKLMIERADQLLKEGKQLDELPTTLAEIVTDYTEQLLRREQDLPSAVQQARIAAHVCTGKERSPAARSENRYMGKGLSKEILVKFVDAGLMVRSGDKSDPFYKFALDPLAEQLDANRLVIGIRDALADQTEIDDLIQQWEQLPEDFIRALRRAAANYRDSIFATQPPLVLKLWPQEEMTRAPEVAIKSSLPDIPAAQ